MSLATIDGGLATNGAAFLPDWFARIGRRQPSTTLNNAGVARDVVTVVAAWQRDAAAGAAPSLPVTEVEAVDFIKDLLRVSRDAVLAAVGIRQKTFYNWYSNGNRARPGSTGTLWPMAQTLHAIALGHPNLAAWFHSDPQAQRAFEAGDANAIILAEADWAVRNYTAPARPVPDFDSTPGQTAGDRPVPRPRRTSRPSRSTTRRRRAETDAG